MGGDHGPSVVIPAVVRAIASLPADVRFLLHGDETVIKAALSKHREAAGRVDIRHSDRVIAMDEKTAQALRRGKGTSMWNAVEAIREGQAGAAVSSGNTGAMVAISKLILRMIGDLERPALVTSIPTPRGKTTFLDVGANIDCDAERLVEFAIMGEAYHRAAHGVSKPTVGLLNVGSEEMKGHEEVREANRILREGKIDLDYRGFVEGDDITHGGVDVIVTDGFTGNVALKTAEGALKLIGGLLRQVFSNGIAAKLAYLLAKPGLDRLREWLDPRRYNGAVMVGLNGVVVKSHGGTDAQGFAHAIDVAMDMVVHRFNDRIREDLARIGLDKRGVREKNGSAAKLAPA